jgi:hypothetical protein
MVMNKFIFCFCMLLVSRMAIAAEEMLLIAPQKGSDDGIPYILNYENMSPKYVLILFPGGNGEVNPKMVDGKLIYKAKGNFLLRARKFLVDSEFVTVATNSSQSNTRIQTIIDDLKTRFPTAQIYLMGTSKGTFDTMALADYLSDKIAGEIHTSSMKGISSFDARKYKNRQLIVHHLQDSCSVTPMAASQASHDKFGTELIVMEGGISVGDACEAFAHHGYNGIEKETSEAIKKWVKQGV